MKTDKKHEQWKTITESDFVTLFIKTWFTYIATLRELNPDVKVFTDEGVPRGDKPFLNAFKDGIMPIVQKQLPIESVEQELFRMYPVSMKKVMDIFPQYFFQTFFRINESFNYTDESNDIGSDGKFKERYEVHLRIVKRCHLKFYFGISGRFRTTNFKEEIKKDIDLQSIIETNVSKHSNLVHNLNESQLIRDFYDSILNEINHTLRNYLSEKLPPKGYNRTINGKIRDACLRLSSALNIKFECNYKYPHEVGALDDLNSYTIIYQLPFNRFGQVEPENVYSKNKEVYSNLIATKGIDWFASYVYALRNALFHEIITPLDEEWQFIFKSSYLVLKQVSDICIDVIEKIIDFPQSKDNAVFAYVTTHQESVFSALADRVILVEYPKMELHNWKIDYGKIILKGCFLAKLKFYNHSTEDIENSAENVQEVERGFDFEVTLNDDFKIAFDSIKGNDCILIKQQNS